MDLDLIALVLIGSNIVTARTVSNLSKSRLEAADVGRNLKVQFHGTYGTSVFSKWDEESAGESGPQSNVK